MNIGNARSVQSPIGVCNRDVIDASPLKYYILVHIQLLNNGLSNTGSGVSALNDFTHVDDMRRIGEHEGVPVGQNLEIVIIGKITVSRLVGIHIIEIIILEMPDILLVYSRYSRPVFEQSITHQSPQILSLAVEYRNM